ncbi:MAG: UMP kinase [Clostridiales bacterium]|nr:UMP kinase [Clostridiales bacterium]
MASKKITRVLLKLSGAALSSKDNVLDFEKLDHVAREISTVVNSGIEIAIVLGGGNIWRGRSSGDMDRPRADDMGMLATTINSIALLDSLEHAGVPAAVFTATPMIKVAEYYTARAAREALSQGKVAILAGGSGNPFFSTDTAAVLRALEINADALLMAKDIDGVYDSDPKKNPAAIKFDELTWNKILELKLGVMDLTAATMCIDGGLDAYVFGLKDGNILKAAKGENTGTYITN